MASDRIVDSNVGVPETLLHRPQIDPAERMSPSVGGFSF